MDWIPYVPWRTPVPVTITLLNTYALLDRNGVEESEFVVFHLAGDRDDSVSTF